MPIQYVAGDLFVNRCHAQALAQGCNCRGSMGAGIAVGFKERYPQMYEEYRRRCKTDPREFNPGDVFLWRADEQPHVFNLATQEDYWRSKATYERVEVALTEMRRQADEATITSIAMPRVGAGYGGLSWNKVKVVIERVFADWSGTLYVYDEFIADQ
ncbi:MAG: macro domain-containing protein [Anaerolineae bacterium]|nr:macro domain-containing protein [Anaerolineae bacterium]